MLVPRAKVATSNSIIWLKHRMELLGCYMPPDREIEFCIDLTLDVQPVSNPPYLMAPAKLWELKIQLQDMLEKGFICPSTSP